MMDLDFTGIEKEKNSGLDFSGLAKEEEFDSTTLKKHIETAIVSGEEPTTWERILKIFQPSPGEQQGRADIAMMKAEETGLRPSTFQPTAEDALK